MEPFPLSYIEKTWCAIFLLRSVHIKGRWGLF